MVLTVVVQCSNTWSIYREDLQSLGQIDRGRACVVRRTTGRSTAFLNFAPTIRRMAIWPRASKLNVEHQTLELDITRDASSSVPEHDNAPPKDTRFWMIIFSISLSSFLSALDTSILSPALPTIASELHSRDLYVWAVNAFLLACTVTSLICAHISNLFGRRFVMITSITLFAIGSAFCGAAPSTAVLILGRAIQGIGSGGILTMSSLIMCDIVPVRERGLYNGFINVAWTVCDTVLPCQFLLTLASR